MNKKFKKIIALILVIALLITAIIVPSLFLFDKETGSVNNTNKGNTTQHLENENSLDDISKDSSSDNVNSSDKNDNDNLNPSENNSNLNSSENSNDSDDSNDNSNLNSSENSNDNDNSSSNDNSSMGSVTTTPPTTSKAPSTTTTKTPTTSKKPTTTSKVPSTTTTKTPTTSKKPTTTSKAPETSKKPVKTDLSKVPYSKTEFETRVLELVNIERAKEENLKYMQGLTLADFDSREEYNEHVASFQNVVSLAPLKARVDIDKLADIRAKEISYHWGHTRPNGESCLTVFPESMKYGWKGENIAGGQTSPEEAVAAWMNSEGHKRNILNPNFEFMGVGHYYDSSSFYGNHWVQVFYTP